MSIKWYVDINVWLWNSVNGIKSPVIILRIWKLYLRGFFSPAAMNFNNIPEEIRKVINADKHAMYCTSLGTWVF